jgi:hypothetical protein
VSPSFITNHFFASKFFLKLKMSRVVVDEWGVEKGEIAVKAILR